MHPCSLPWFRTSESRSLFLLKQNMNRLIMDHDNNNLSYKIINKYYMAHYYIMHDSYASWELKACGCLLLKNPFLTTSVIRVAIALLSCGGIMFHDLWCRD